MKGILISALLAWGTLAASAAQATEAQLHLSSSTVRQGQQFQVAFFSDTPGPYQLEVAGQTLELFAQGQRHTAFVAIPPVQKPGGYTLRIRNADGQEMAQQKLEVSPVRFATQNIRFYKPALTAEQKKVLEQEEALVDAARSARSPQAYFDGAFNLPVPHRISSTYGIHRLLNGKLNGYHGGVDFASPMSYPIKAPAGARVSLAKYMSKWNDNGNLIFLDHGLGITSVYIHLSKIAVKEGELVKKGQTIGYIGSTGRSTGPHLHWGLYLNGKNTDGLGWVAFSQNFQFSQGLPFSAPLPTGQEANPGK